ncbi:MAG: hypothetical protein M3Y50_09540 [Acidobacteriota bacterium]|nr:hypothetical protein [Acidobacteriota bacterium]
MWVVYHTQPTGAVFGEPVVNADRVRFDAESGMHVGVTLSPQRLAGRD